jgi:hypothetical protein
MLEPYASKDARTVLRGREGSDPLLLPDQQTGHAKDGSSDFNASSRVSRLLGVSFGDRTGKVGPLWLMHFGT